MKPLCLYSVLFFFLFSDLHAQQWSYQDDFAYGEYPHGVVVTPDDKIWVGFYSWTDTMSIPGGIPKPYNPIKIYDSDGILHQEIQLLEYGGQTDTVFSCRGISLDNNGNVLFTNYDALYRINYESHEVMNKAIPDAAFALTEAACDENGFIYLAHVGPSGRPLYIYDQNFQLYGYVDDDLFRNQRSILTSINGKDVYLGRIYYGQPEHLTNGIIHYHSDTGPGGNYVKVDSFQLDIWAQCLDWDRSGLMWIGSYWDIYSNDSTGWYALDPTQNFSIVNRIGFNGLDPITGPIPPEGGSFYAPRGAAWSLDGTFMYTADFDGHVIKRWYNPNPKISHIELSVGMYNFFAGDTIQIPVNVSFDTYASYSSTEIDISGYHGKLELLDVVADSCLIGDAGWSTEVNETETQLKIASAGSDNINGSGVLLWLQFAIPDTACPGFVPINLDYGIFNTGMTPTTLISGGVTIDTFSVHPGDVDLNSIVQAYDASLILKYLVDLIELSEQQLLNANVSMDETVSALDATFILQYVVGTIDVLPYDGSAPQFMATGSLNMEDRSIEPGATIELPVYLQGGSNIFAFEGSFSFDPALLTFNEIIWSSQLNHFNKEINTQDGIIQFAGAGSQEDGEEGVFGTVSFTVNESFASDSTVVRLESLRWNEGSPESDVTQATLYHFTALERISDQMPIRYTLEQNFPNPFNPQTTIRFHLPEAARVSLTIYNSLGQKVAILVDGDQPAGLYALKFEAGQLCSGLYYCHFQANGYSQIRKMLLMK